MKKEIFIFILFVAMITAAFLNIRHLKTLTTELEDYVEGAEKSAQAGNWEAAERHAQDALNLWQAHTPYTYIVLHHGSIDRAEDVLHALLREIRARDADVVKAAAQEVSAKLESLYNIERVWLGSIF